MCGGAWQVIIKRKESVLCFRDPGFGHNKVRDSGNVDGIRYLTATGKAGSAKIWARMRDWERHNIRDNDDRSSGRGIPVKKSGNAGSGPPLIPLHYITNLYTRKFSVYRTIFFTPVMVKYMENNLDITKPRYSEQILPVPWHFFFSRFHCNKIYKKIKEKLLLEFHALYDQQTLLYSKFTFVFSSGYLCI